MNFFFFVKIVIYGKYTMLDFSFTVHIQYVKSDALIRRPGHERFGSSHIQLEISIVGLRSIIPSLGLRMRRVWQVELSVFWSLIINNWCSRNEEKS